MISIKKISVSIAFVGALFASSVAGAACNRNNLIRCLDSACINNTSSTGDRCALCGLASASDRAAPAPKTYPKGMSYTLSDKEIKALPSDPGKRYVRAREICFEKVTDCVDDDATKYYWPLIEQSCAYIGADAELSRIAKDQSKTKSKSVCEVDIQVCILKDAKCAADYSKCTTDSLLSGYYSECRISESCGHLDMDESESVLANIKYNRDNFFAARAKNLSDLVSDHESGRARRINSVKEECAPGGENIYVGQYCAYMPNSTVDDMGNCEFGSDEELRLAKLLAKFLTTACTRID